MRRVLVVGLLVAAAFVAQLGPRIVNANQATPAGAADSGSLGEMLSLLPPLPLAGDTPATVSYFNLAGQLAAVGMPPTRSADETGDAAWFAAIQPVLYLQDTIKMRQPEWREVFGFGLEEIDQAVEYAAPPLSATVIRGRLDANDLRAAWERSGYQPIEIDGTTVYSFGEDFALDVESPVSRLALAHMNNVALIGNDLLAATSSREAMRGVLAATRGDEASFADGVAIAPLVRAAPTDLGAATFVDGSMLIGMPDPSRIFPVAGTPGAVDAIATEMAEEIAEAQRLPPVVTAMMGSTFGGPFHAPIADDEAATPAPFLPDARQAREVIALTFTSPAMAETASAVIADRLETQPMPDSAPVPEGIETYAELFVERSVTPIADEPVVVVDLLPSLEAGRVYLINFLYRRALTIVAWSL